MIRSPIIPSYRIVRSPLVQVTGYTLAGQLGEEIRNESDTYLFDASDLTSVYQDLNGTAGTVKVRSVNFE